MLFILDALGSPPSKEMNLEDNTKITTALIV